jgi:excisionase family DNA binding protein
MSGSPVAERGDKPRSPVLSSHPPRAGSAAPATPDSRRAYSLNEAARVLGVSRSTIYKAIKCGEIRTIRLCGRCLVVRDSLEELLAGNQ